MKDWRKRTFPVGVKEDSIHGELMEYPLSVYYPALKEGPDATPDERHAYPGLIFAHGFASAAQDYTYIGQVLGSHGYVAAFFSAGKRRGGYLLRTIDPVKAVAQHRDAITKTIDYLHSNPMKIVLTDKIGIAGHSLGGITCLQAAARDNRLKAVVACSAVNIQIILGNILGGLGKTLSRKIFGNSDFAQGIKVPTLLIHGARDKLTPIEHGLSYYDMIRDTSKEVLGINGPISLMGEWMKAHLLGLVLVERMGYDYTPTVLKYMINWFNFFLYKDTESWTYLFGKAIQNDITKKILSKNRFFINQV